MGYKIGRNRISKQNIIKSLSAMIQKQRQVIELIKQTFNTKPKNRRFAIFNTHLNRTTLQGAFTSLPKSVGAAFSKEGRKEQAEAWLASG